MQLKYSKMLGIVLHENMKLEDNTLSNKRLSSCKHPIFDKILVNCSPYFAAYNTSMILKLKGHIKGRLILKILNFKKNLSSGLKTIC